MNSKVTFRTLSLVGISILAAAWGTQPTHGQMEFMSEAMYPEFFTRDLVVFSEGLNLEDDQEVIVEAMFDSFSDDFEAGWAATQERLNSIANELRENKPTNDRDMLKPVLEALGSWLDEKRSLDTGLLENVNTILIGEQLELWPAFTQKLYREKHVNRGRIGGESTDLFQVVRDTDLSGTAEVTITPHLDEYAVAMDGAMRKRDSILRGNPKKLFESILDGDSSRSPDHIEALIKARINVRDINDRYIDVIGSSLSSKDGKDFRARALERGYPRIYRRTPAQRILRQAAENDSYDPEIHALIMQLEYAYLGELEILNYELLRLTRNHDPKRERNRALAGQARRGGGTPQKLEDPTRSLYKKREALGRRYIEMLRDLLSPEAFLELDGSRRWIPREEQTNAPAMPPAKPPRGPDGELRLQDNQHKESGKKNKTKGGSKPDSSGFGNSKDDRGSGISGGS